MKRDQKDTFTMPKTTGTGRKGGKKAVIKEPPYHDLPTDPIRPPHG